MNMYLWRKRHADIGMAWIYVIRNPVAQFFYLSALHNLPMTYPLFFHNIQLFPSTINILQNLNLKFHISSPAKSTSLRLGILYCLHQSALVWSMHLWYEGAPPPTNLLDRVELKSLSHQLPSPCWSLLPLRFFYNVLLLFSFCWDFHADYCSELANCIPSLLWKPHCTWLHSSSSMLSKSLMLVDQQLHFFILFGGKLWNSLSLFIFPLTYKLTFQRFFFK